MKIQWDTVWLADDELKLHPSQIRIGWRQINQEVEFLRAVNPTFFDRKQRSFTFGFVVKRGFDTVRAAEQFCFEHFPSLPGKATLLCRVGAIGEILQDISMPGAVIEGAEPTPFGKSVEIRYAFRCAQISIVVAGSGQMLFEGGEGMTFEDGGKMQFEGNP